MKDKLTSDELRELLWRRQLNAAERASAATQPELPPDLQLEARLSDALARLPEASVPSNFTVRVWQAIDREDSRRPVALGQWVWMRWLPRVAVTAAVAGFAAVSWQHHEINEQRSALAHQLARVAESATLPNVEALKNYDAIQRMGQSQSADDALLALMQ